MLPSPVVPTSPVRALKVSGISLERYAVGCRPEALGKCLDLGPVVCLQGKQTERAAKCDGLCKCTCHLYCFAMEKGVSLIGVACKGSILCNILQAAGICSLVDLVFERCRTARRFFLWHSLPRIQNHTPAKV